MKTAVGLLVGSQTAIVSAGFLSSPSWVVMALAFIAIIIILAELRAFRALFLEGNGYGKSVEAIVGQRTKDLQYKVKQLESEAITDFLTGIMNRRGGENSFHLTLLRCQRMQTSVSFILVDLDSFKSVNDTLGHKFGDLVLCTVAKAIASHLRATDILCRWGGDEILVCLPDTDISGALLVAEKLRATIEDLSFSDGFQVTASFGCAEAMPGENANNVLARTDQNLYLAKARGRNCVFPKRAEKKLDVVAATR